MRAIDADGLITAFPPGEYVRTECVRATIDHMPTIEPEQKCEDFEKGLHDMFDHIWDCDINHPIFQDTVGELMGGVIQLYNNTVQPERKKGKWMRSNPLTDTLVCSKCDWNIPSGEFITNFCQNCGADMNNALDWLKSPAEEGEK